jgi:hypothetical protein
MNSRRFIAILQARTLGCSGSNGDFDRGETRR